jgi:putative lipoic acid-binding regulatory protein
MDAPKRPQIEYPAPWTYTVVGSDRKALFALIERTLASEAHEKHFSHTSSQGRYCSIEVTLIVRDEARRLAIFDAFKSDPAVRYVL